MKMRKNVYQDFLEFRSNVIQAIATAWNDDQYRQQLLEDPKKAMAERLGYHYPFDMDLKAQYDNATWDQKANSGWVVNKENIVELVLPPRPEVSGDSREKALQEALALAEFNTHHITFLAPNR